MMYRFVTIATDNGFPLFEMLVERNLDDELRTVFVAVVDHQRRPSPKSHVEKLPVETLYRLIDTTEWQRPVAIPPAVVAHVVTQARSRGCNSPGEWSHNAEADVMAWVLMQPGGLQKFAKAAGLDHHMTGGQ